MPLTEMKEDEEFDDDLDELEEGNLDENEELEGDEIDDEEVDAGTDGGIDGEYTAEEHIEAQESDEEESDDDYSKNVRRRIGKEVSKRKRIESERDIVRKELHNTQVELAKIKSDAIKSERERLANEITLLQTNAKKTLEEGETDEYIKISDRLVDAKVELSRNNDYVEQTYEAPADQGGYTPAASEWMNKNSGWINKNKAKFERAKRLSNQLETEGYTVDDPAMYAEMDRRLGMSSKKPMQSTHIPDGGQSVRQANKRTGLSDADKALMRDYNLNPNNPEHRQTWLKSKK